MNAHRSLQRLDVLRYPVDQIALMIASEFLRAGSRAQYPQIVEGCFHRARELMGILETIELHPAVACDLRPYYEKCSERELFVSNRITSPDHVRLLSQDLAEAFESASEKLKGNALA